jgi:hypothetical protein
LAADRPLRPWVALGFAVGATGGPLAIAVIYLLGSVNLSPSDLPLGTLLAGLILLGPLAVWRGYAQEVASAGGLAAFSAAGGGERFGRWQAWIWTVSYLLYLPYTVTYLVYYLLPDILHVPSAPLEIALPVLIGLLMLRGGRAAIHALAVSGAVQLVAVVALAGFALAHFGLRLAPPQAGAADLVAGGAQIALLFVCMNLVVFLGAEVKGGAIPRILGQATAIGVAATLAAALTLASGTTAAVAASDLPGFTLARGLGWGWAATALALLALLSIAGLIVAEFAALERLWRPQIPPWAIAAFFVAADALSLLGPQTFYRLTILPSLIALYIAQLLVFAVYPAFVRRRRALRLADVAATAVACLWAAYGLFGVITRPPLS